MNKLVRRLAAATPAGSVLQWIFITMLYGVGILVNEHFDLIQSLGLDAQTEAFVRLMGAYLYIVLTTLQFQRTKTRDHERR